VLLIINKEGEKKRVEVVLLDRTTVVSFTGMRQQREDTVERRGAVILE